LKTRRFNDLVIVYSPWFSGSSRLRVQRRLLCWSRMTALLGVSSSTSFVSVFSRTDVELSLRGSDQRGNTVRLKLLGNTIDWLRSESVSRWKHPAKRHASVKRFSSNPLLVQEPFIALSSPTCGHKRC